MGGADSLRLSVSRVSTVESVFMDADYIVVGAGSAGCVLANRLSANPNNRVLLLEAGGQDKSFWITTPIGYGRLFHDPTVNWRFTTEPDQGLRGRRAYWPRGRVLGGSSSINAMVCIRGRAEDYQEWVSATGDPGWGPERMASAYFSLIDPDQPSGGFPITRIDEDAHPLTASFFAALGELGIPFISDFNGDSQEGGSYYRINTRDGRRVSSAEAFVRPALDRANLDIRLDTCVRALTFDGKRCTGVEIDQDGEKSYVTAAREVIVAAGAVGSPKILQLSGIGNGEELNRFGIPVRVDNPNVGENLQDHVGVTYSYRSSVPTLNQELAPLARRLWNGVRYLTCRSGPLSMSVNQGGAFFRTSPDLPLPNMQLYLQVITTLGALDQKRPLLAPDPFPAFSLGLSNVRPKSRGRIGLASPDPAAPPSIQPNVYSEEDDLNEMIEAVRFVRRLAETRAFSKVIDAELVPGPDVVSENELIDDIRQRTGTVFHPCGTCSMGRTPQRSVLAPDLRVWGVEGLRVADASAFPNIVSGNLNLPVMMLAERAAKIILNEE